MLFWEYHTKINSYDLVLHSTAVLQLQLQFLFFLDSIKPITLTIILRCQFFYPFIYTPGPLN